MSNISQFQFPPEIQKGIAEGIYKIMVSEGVEKGIAVNVKTGKIVGHAIKIIAKNGHCINPLFSSFQLVTSAAQVVTKVVQIHQDGKRFEKIQQGIQEIQSSLGVLQATTAVIGVGTYVGVGLSAVNVWQTLKLRQDIKQLKLQVHNGFIDLKTALKDGNREVIQHIDRVAEDIKFEQHRLELIKAYGKFIEATKLIKTAIQFQNINSRNIELANARQTLGEALAIYNNQNLLSATSVVGKLRRLECAWAIEQTIILTYQLQQEMLAVSDCLKDLQAKIRHNCYQIIDNCSSFAELDFIFPEISCICDRDLIILETWSDRVDYLHSLPASELESWQLPENKAIDTVETASREIAIEKPIELIEYEATKTNSHYDSLKDQLKIKVSPDLRPKYQQIIKRVSNKSGHKILTENIDTASDETLANLYWYFQVREKLSLETI